MSDTAVLALRKLGIQKLMIICACGVGRGWWVRSGGLGVVGSSGGLGGICVCVRRGFGWVYVRMCVCVRGGEKK